MGRIGGFVVADNPGAGDAEWVARDRLGHELMYFSRGNPVIYYGDEQGFTGSGRRPGRAADPVRLPGAGVPGRRPAGHVRHPRAGQLHPRPPAVPLDPRPGDADSLSIPRCATARSSTGTSAPAAGVYAFSRIDQRQQREYVVAAEQQRAAPAPAAIPTYTSRDQFKRVYGVGSVPAVVRSERCADGLRSRTVHRGLRTRTAGSPARHRAPRISLDAPSPATGGRMQVSASVAGSSFYEVTFYAKVNGRWSPIGTDDNAPYRVFHDVSGLTSGAAVEYRAVVAGQRRPHPLGGSRTRSRARAGGPHRGARRGRRRPRHGRGTRGRRPGASLPRDDVRALRGRRRLDPDRQRLDIPGVHGVRRSGRSGPGSRDSCFVSSFSERFFR